MRLLLRIADTTIPVFLALYLGVAWSLWGEGETLREGARGPELTGLARWLCLGWVPSAALALGAFYLRAWRGALGELAPGARHRIALGFLATIPVWLAATEWAVHRMHADRVMCTGTLVCGAERLASTGSETDLAPDPRADTSGELASEPGERVETGAPLEIARPSLPAAVPGAASASSAGLADAPAAATLALPASGSGPADRPQPDGGGAPPGSGPTAALTGAARSDPGGSPRAEAASAGATSDVPQPATRASVAPGSRIDGGRRHANGRPRCKGRLRVSDAGEPVREGAWTEWWPSGEKRSEGRYVEGEREGPWREWHDNGALALSATYRGGHAQGDLQRFHPDGGVALHRDELRTDDGRVLWMEETFHANGRRARRAQYQDGVLHGPARRWTEEGALREAGAYRAGYRHGTWIRYAAGGGVEQAQVWEDGTQVKSGAPVPAAPAGRASP